MGIGRDVRAVCYSAGIEVIRSLHVGLRLRNGKESSSKETFDDGIDIEVVQVFGRVLVLKLWQLWVFS